MIVLSAEQNVRFARRIFFFHHHYGGEGAGKAIDLFVGPAEGGRASRSGGAARVQEERTQLGDLCGGTAARRESRGIAASVSGVARIRTSAASSTRL